MAYSKEYLLEKLREILDKYGVIQTKLIDQEPGFPNRKAYTRAFGSIAKACEEIGYTKYQKRMFNISDAQRVLNERNGNFQLLDFNGMREKNLTQCKKCGYTWNVSTDSLLRNNTNSNGCPQCSRKSFLSKIQDNNLRLLEYLGNSSYLVECTQCNTKFERRSNILSSPKFLCPYCLDNKKYAKINQHKNLYRKQTTEFSDFLMHLEKIANEQSLMWFYCLGLLFADGHFDTNIYRVKLALHPRDEETVNTVANFFHCKPLKYDDRVEINFCGKYVIEELINCYKIHSAKTYNPCDITSIVDNKMIAFIIGFIDGDGCIRKRTDSDLYFISIKLHKSWENNLNLMGSRLYNFFNVNKIPHAVTIKSQDKEYTQITFGNSIVLNGLVNFIQEHNLPVMQRKWDKILTSRKYQENIELKGE